MLEQGREVSLEPFLVITRSLAVDTWRLVLVRETKSLTQKIGGDVMSKGRKCHLRGLPRQLRYPLQSW